MCIRDSYYSVTVSNFSKTTQEHVLTFYERSLAANYSVLYIDECHLPLRCRTDIAIGIAQVSLVITDGFNGQLKKRI